MRPLLAAAVTVTAFLLLALFISCGGNGVPVSGFRGTQSLASVSTSISDPATCAAPIGPFSHIVLTVRDVRANVNPNAPDNDPGVVDLTPNMTPVQIDLLGAASSQCILAQLATNVQIPSGTYQQIRILLLDNNQTLASTDQCGVGNGVNCVVLTSDGSTHQIDLSAEATAGIKLTNAQISGGSVLIVSGGQTVNLNLDINGCTSVVPAANGHFRLQPAVHAAAIDTNANNAITGRVVDSVTLAAISGKVFVALEQKNSTGADRILLEVSPDGAGNFVLCPVPAGTYEVVATAVNAANVAYAATVAVGVQPGANLGNVPLVAQPGSGPASTAATITGAITTAGPAGATAVDVVVSAMQNVIIPSLTPTSPTTVVPVTIPLAAQGFSTAIVTTLAGACVPATVACGSYNLPVPAANPNFGVFNTSGTVYSQDVTSPVAYSVDGQAFFVTSPGTPDCIPSNLRVNTTSVGGPLTVSGGTTVTAALLAFTGCQ